MSLMTAMAVFLSAPVLRAAPQPEDPIASAVFTENAQTQDTLKPDQRGLGVVMQDSLGWGLVYRQKFALDRSVWARGTYTPDRFVFLNSYEPSPEVAYAEIHEKNRQQISVGIDQVFHLTQNKYWGFILGVGAGVIQSQYQSHYYRQLCTFVCGFDRRSQVEKNETDLYGFISGTIGIGFFETLVWGLKGDLIIASTPISTRTGSFAFRGPDGRELSANKYAPYVIEGVVSF